MAKLRRPQPKPAKPNRSGPAESRSARAPDTRPARETKPAPPQRQGQAKPAEPQRRSTYVDAVALYERGLEALQRHEYQKAADIFESVLRQYPEERELDERVRLYLNICQRHAAPRESTPKTVDERLYAATLAINGGQYDQAIGHLRLVRDEDPDNDHALYMLAVAHAQRGEPAEAIAHLERAIALNSENRGLARTDPDLEPLRGDDAFRGALDTPSLPRGDRRRPLKSKTAR